MVVFRFTLLIIVLISQFDLKFIFFMPFCAFAGRTADKLSPNRTPRNKPLDKLLRGKLSGKLPRVANFRLVHSGTRVALTAREPGGAPNGFGRSPAAERISMYLEPR